MFEEIITRLLQGQFICEASAPSLFRQFDTESYRDEVDQGEPQNSEKIVR